MVRRNAGMSGVGTACARQRAAADPRCAARLRLPRGLVAGRQRNASLVISRFCRCRLLYKRLRER